MNARNGRRSGWWLVVLLVGWVGWVEAADPPYAPKPVPVLQAVPLPHHEVSFQHDGVELCRLHHAPDQNRPFLFPIRGPSGRSLTRMGHPHDPVTHSHHNSVWISHADVDGLSFWDDQGRGRIVHRRVERLEDGSDAASVLTASDWLSTSNGVVVLAERRWTTVLALPGGEWELRIELELAASGKAVTLGKTPFGPMAVRMAKTLGVHDGGGRMRNSEGGLNEAGCFWKPARWVDYSGPITATATEGIALFDHPANPNHPNPFHVRDDGWMGVSVSHAGPLVIVPGRPLRLRYGLWVHAGMPEPERIEARWKAFADQPLPGLSGAR